MTQAAKDYYKILGVKETASMDEIRDRWIELVREFHPDQAKEPKWEDQERVKEINEAYQVLKHSSTRVEYDLKRSYGMKKKRRSFQRWVVPLGSCIALIIIGSIISNQPREPSPLKPAVPLAEETAGSQKDVPAEKTRSHDRVFTHPSKPEKRTLHEEEKLLSDEKSQEVRPVLGHSPSKETTGVLDKESAKGVRNFGRAIKTDAARNQSAVIPAQAEVTRPISAGDKKAVFAEEVRTSPRERDKVTTEALSRDQDRNDITGMARPQEPEAGVRKAEPDKTVPAPRPEQDPVKVSPVETYEKGSFIYHPSLRYAFAAGEEPAELPKLNGLIADGEEIEEFFLKYTEKYVQRDVIGFLQLFSVRAVQNKKQKIEDIRNIYKDFFSQSRQLLYRLEELRAEVYQNAVEVRSGYRVDQVLKKGGEEKVWRGPIRWVLIKEDAALRVVLLDYQHLRMPWPLR